MHILRPAVVVASLIASTAAIAQRGRSVEAERGPSCTTITGQELSKTGSTTVAETVGNLPTAPGGAAPSKPACTPPTPSAATPQPVQPVQPVQPTPAASVGKTASDVKPEPPKSAPNGLDDRLSQAEQKLDADIKACKPINADDYKPLFEEADNNLKMAVQAKNAGVPVDKEKIIFEHRRAISVYQRAQAAAAKQSTDCPPKALPKITEKTTSDQHSSVTPVPLTPFNQRILDIHNTERTAVGVPALRWNMQLEMGATAYAQQLARTGQLVHAPREGRGIERENLQQGLLGWSPDRMTQSWTAEKGDFVAGYYPNVARDANWVNVSHYTQMIWPTTTDIGCGMADGRGFVWLDCRYSPGGNKDGKQVGQLPVLANRTSQANSVLPATASPCAQGWTDLKTGKPVKSLPVMPDPVYTRDGKYAGPRAVSADLSDRARAYDPRSGRNFFYDGTTCEWKDAKTGKPVKSLPVMPDPVYTRDGKYAGPRAVSADLSDPARAYDPATGRNFAKVPATDQPAHRP